MKKKYLFGIIGAGNMANAIVNGIITAKIISPQNMIISDISYDNLQTYVNLGLNTTINNEDIFENCEYILFAIKPQIFNSIKDSFPKGDYKIISIMAGVNIESFKETFGKDTNICRIMPNTPSMIGQGMSVLSFENFDAESQDFVKSIFNSIGEVAVMDESQFDAVTSVSGSGPAYIYMFLEGMIKGGIEGGLSEKDSRKLAIQTMVGSANMVKNKAEIPIADLINAVCSKGGTTIEAVNFYRENNLTETISGGIEKCRNRSKELSKK